MATKLQNDISFCEDCFRAIQDRISGMHKLFSLLRQPDEVNRNKAGDCKQLLYISNNLQEDIDALVRRLNEIVEDDASYPRIDPFV